MFPQRDLHFLVTSLLFYAGSATDYSDSLLPYFPPCSQTGRLPQLLSL